MPRGDGGRPTTPACTSPHPRPDHNNPLSGRVLCRSFFFPDLLTGRTLSASFVLEFRSALHDSGQRRPGHP